MGSITARKQNNGTNHDQELRTPSIYMLVNACIKQKTIHNREELKLKQQIHNRDYGSKVILIGFDFLDGPSSVKNAGEICQR